MLQDFPSGKALVHWKLTWNTSSGWLGLLIPWGQGLTSCILNPSLYVGQGPTREELLLTLGVEVGLLVWLCMYNIDPPSDDIKEQNKWFHLPGKIPKPGTILAHGD